MKNKIFIYDTTLRDGSQAEGVSFSVEDKILIAKKLDELGIHYLEGGQPGSNLKDIEFFQKVSKIKFKNIKVSAFGSTRHAKNKVSEDTNIKELILAKTPVVTIFGKSWDFHVKSALRVSEETNLEMIYDSIKFLKSFGKEIIYDAEHFFDGFIANKEYAMNTIKKAEQAGADNISLCETNGGRLPFEIEEIIKYVKTQIKTPIGFHGHNDGDLGVANSLVAARCGCVIIQGTINGYGERCGNANLCSIIPNLQLKMGMEILQSEKLKKLTEVSRFVSELANVVPNERAPYVGLSAFAHKGGIHVSAVQRDTRTYEHINPELVGNHRRVLVSELSGKSNILYKAKELGISFTDMEHIPQQIVQKIKHLENEGYQFEGAEGSLELMIKKSIGKYKPLFELHGYRLIIEKQADKSLISEATIKLSVQGKEEYTVAEGNGPVNALDNALKKALLRFYPEITKMRLIDYKVRVLDSKFGTAARVRVLIESQYGTHEWGTVGVSENIIEASWDALVDAIEYMMLKYV